MSDEPTPVRWRVTREPRAEDILCDLCGEQTDTLHFVPYVKPCEQVVFACPAHCPMPQGYMVEIDRWFRDGWQHWADHIGPKYNDEGYYAIAVLADRFTEI